MESLFKYVLILVGVVLLTPACNDHLNLAPLDAPSNENFYNTKDELLLAINGAYEQTFRLEYSWENIPAFAEYDNMTDLAFDRGHSGANAIARGIQGSSSSYAKNTWGYYFKAIARVNNLLGNLDGAKNNVSEDFLKRIEAEARFLRAFSYLNLSELFGDVPLLTQTPDVNEVEIARTPKAEVVDQIIADLDMAAQTLPLNWGEQDEGRATRGAALALKARTALYNKRYGAAAEAAQLVMNLGEYSLYPDYRNLFQYEGESSSEVILELPFKYGVYTHTLPRDFASQLPSAAGWSTHVPSQFLIDSYETTDGKPIDESSLYDSANPFENRDPRLKASIFVSGDIWGNFIFQTHPDSVQTWRVNNEGERIERIPNDDATYAFATYTGYLWKKYMDQEEVPDNVADSELNFMLIRYAEVLLTYAEAKIELNEIDQSVLDAINKVRARAYGVEVNQASKYPAATTQNQSELRRIVRRERKVEFAGEGLRLFDILRWRIAENVMNGVFVGRPDGSYSMVTVPEINDETGHPEYGGELNLYKNIETRSFDSNKNYLWPIPQSELDVNDAINQNPGY